MIIQNFDSKSKKKINKIGACNLGKRKKNFRLELLFVLYNLHLPFLYVKINYDKTSEKFNINKNCRNCFFVYKYK